MRGFLFSFILFFSYYIHCSTSPSLVPLIPKTVRVAIFRNIDHFSLQGIDFKIFDFDNKKTLSVFKRNSQIEFKFVSDSISFENIVVKNSKHLIIFSSLPNSELSINNKSYRGILDIYNEGKSFLIVNHVQLDKYLASILNKEMNSSWPIEALKAQAIAARTYALACMAEQIHENYDVEADVRDQVYEGSKLEDRKTLSAVLSSEGEVLTYKGEVLKTYYHANSGGHTENPSLIWGGNPDYMPAIEDPFVFSMPGYIWNYKITIKDLTSIIKSNGFSFNTLFDIDVCEYSASGRANKVCIKSENNLVFSIPGKSFREMLGKSKIKSTKFIITTKGDNIVEFAGRGSGHGAGLSQWGAKKMGDMGLSYLAILKHYYPQLSIKKLW